MKATRPTDGRLKANRDRARFMQRAVYMPWMQGRLCSRDEVAELYASDRPAPASQQRQGERLQAMSDDDLLRLLQGLLEPHGMGTTSAAGFIIAVLRERADKRVQG